MTRATAAVAALLLGGCSASRATVTGVTGPGMTPRREASLLALASGVLACPKAGLVPAYIESSDEDLHLYRVAGCGASMNVLLHCRGPCLWVEMPDKLAAGTLGCPAEQLELRYLEDVTWSYRGCGRASAWARRPSGWEPAQPSNGGQ